MRSLGLESVVAGERRIFVSGESDGGDDNREPMKEICLTQGHRVLIDDVDYTSLSRFRWRAQKDWSTWYAVRSECVGGMKKAMLMHRVILGLGYGDPQLTDHVDGNGLNNTRANLRIATHAENSHNYKRPRTNRSGFKGVSWSKAHRKWRAQIKVNGKDIHLGYFRSPVEAARAYDVAALKYHGEFARTNERE